MHYRRCFVKGGCYFFTVNLAERDKSLLTDNIHLLRSSYQKMLATRPVKTIAAVVLPDHLHVIWQLPAGDCDFAQRWRQIKVNFSRHIVKNERISKSRLDKNERGIWQRRYWEHLIRDEDDLQKHVAYIHYNPVKHGYVLSPVDWPYSSIHKYIKLGWIKEDWGC
ncbi:transposase [Catenovulum sp. 2E275]|uniref:REP-associated tyrosine transposase n=1 Tax=Catenovulum sp. 2E275 TaxID=2980497 RepID=UPI0021CEB349|nr:transposase [Catenovulum sp. 2E275]MCU4675236.1 transposase [Catenovulum sp. 2E275]